MDLRRLDDWIAYVEQAAGQRRAAHTIDGGGWSLSMSTPPPVLQDPMARIPLERARELAVRLEREEDPDVRENLLQQALQWLDYLHPNTAPELEQMIDRKRRYLLALNTH